MAIYVGISWGINEQFECETGLISMIYFVLILIRVAVNLNRFQFKKELFEVYVIVIEIT